jgi:hypothetical protein
MPPTIHGNALDFCDAVGVGVYWLVDGPGRKTSVGGALLPRAEP